MGRMYISTTYPSYCCHELGPFVFKCTRKHLCLNCKMSIAILTGHWTYMYDFVILRTLQFENVAHTIALEKSQADRSKVRFDPDM